MTGEENGKVTAPEEEPGGLYEESERSPNGEDEERQKKRGWIGFLTKLIPLLTAIVGFLAAIVAVWWPTNDERAELAKEAATLNEQVESLTVEVSTLQEVKVDLEGQNVELKERVEEQNATIESLEEIDDRESQATPEDDADGTSEPGGNQPVAVFRESDRPVVLNGGFGIRLDSLEENWNVASTATGRDLYLAARSTGLELRTRSGPVAVMDREASYGDCDRETDLQDELLPEQTAVGTQFCIKTNDNRWAFVTIVGLDTEQESISLNILVWSPTH